MKTAKSQSTSSASTVGGSESGTAIMSLKQKIHGLEQALRKKENDLVEVKRSLGATEIAELKIQAEVHCREIDRYVCCLCMFMHLMCVCTYLYACDESSGDICFDDAH